MYVVSALNTGVRWYGAPTTTRVSKTVFGSSDDLEFEVGEVDEP